MFTPTGSNRYRANTWLMPAGAHPWRWNGQRLDAAGWKANNQDMLGAFGTR
jgi:hypothetical protein